MPLFSGIAFLWMPAWRMPALPGPLPGSSFEPFGPLIFFPDALLVFMAVSFLCSGALPHLLVGAITPHAPADRVTDIGHLNHQTWLVRQNPALMFDNEFWCQDHCRKPPRTAAFVIVPFAIRIVPTHNAIFRSTISHIEAE
jgi:hypothetical protein